MPKKSGKEAFQEIKVIHPKIKTIFVSGYPQDLLDFEGMEGQEVNCLQKPVRPTELLKKVREILDNTNS
jgi:DNA-binding response OmpR family regulator